MEETIKTSARVNYRSDFNLILRLRSHDGTDIGFPSFDWEARFYTGLKANAFVASCRGGICENCFNDGGRIHIVFDNHLLSQGELKVEFVAYIPNDDYPDGAEKIVVPKSLGIVLTRCAAPCAAGITSELVLPVIIPAAEIKVLEVRIVELESRVAELAGINARLSDSLLAIEKRLAVFEEGGGCCCRPEPEQIGEPVSEDELEDLIDDGIAQNRPDVVDAENRLIESEIEDLIDDGIAQERPDVEPGEHRVDESEIEALIQSIFSNN